MAPTPKLRLLRNRPLCIICGRPAEAEGIAKALGIEKNRITGHEVLKVNNGYTFYIGSFTLESGEELQYYVTSSLRQGIQSFTVYASILFGILRPRFVIHAGVCAGYYDPTGKLKMKITDVVFAEAATNYQEGKMEYVEGELSLRPDYNRVQYDVGDMQAFADSASRPTYHYGEFLSGSSVRTDAHLIFEKIRANVNRNAIALDMEASAFLQLCTRFEGDQVLSLGVVKGISDFGDLNKGSIQTAYPDALKNTAQALQEWIVHRIRAITWTADESDEPGAKIVPGYYENFIRRVLDNYLQGWPVRNKSDPSVVIPREEIKGFKTVLPKGNDPGFAQELGHVQALVQRYHVGEVDIGGTTAGRYLYYKDGYLIDWARTVNSLKICEDGEYQVGVFGRLLGMSPYYNSSSDSPALASVVSWEDTVEWLKTIEQNETELKSATGEAERNQEVDNGRRLKGEIEEKKHLGSEATEKKEAQDQNAREGRPPRRDEGQAHIILGEGRQESPESFDDPTSSTDRGCGSLDMYSSAHNDTAAKDQLEEVFHSRNGVGGHFTSVSARAESNEPKDKQRSSTEPLKRARSKEAHRKKKTLSLSPKRSMSRFLQRFRSAPVDQQPRLSPNTVPL